MKTEDAPIVQTMEQEYYLDDTGELIHFEDHQRRILNEVFMPNEEGKIGYETVVWSTPKKEGKTGVAGAVGYGFSRTFGGNTFSLANDKEQAGERMFDRVVSNFRHMKEKNPSLFETIVKEDYHDKITKNNMIEFEPINQVNPGPHWLKFIAADYAGEAGGRPAMTCFDELWAFKGDRMARLWDEFQPLSIMKVSLRFITTYAGWYGESDLLWGIYETVVKPDSYNPLEKHGTKIPGLEDLPVYSYGEKYKSGSYLVYWDHENRMPWKSEEYLEGRRLDPAVKGRESEYDRIWRNMWTTGLDAFLSPQTVDRLMKLGEEQGLVNNMSDW